MALKSSDPETLQVSVLRTVLLDEHRWTYYQFKDLLARVRQLTPKRLSALEAAAKDPRQLKLSVGEP